MDGADFTADCTDCADCTADGRASSAPDPAACAGSAANADRIAAGARGPAAQQRTPIHV